VKSIKNKIKHYFGKHPRIFFPIFKLVSKQNVVEECLLDKKSELVIEGFPRSANTYSVVAFRQAQNRTVSMGHHLHVEAQILKPVDLGLPVVALIRHPEDAIKSLLIRHPNEEKEESLKRYIDFYSAVEQVRDKVVIANFIDVTTNFSTVIEQVNKKFNTTYQLFIHNDENIDKIYREIERINEALDLGKETHVARPSKERDNVKNSILFTKEDEKLLEDAVSLYCRLIQK